MENIAKMGAFIINIIVASFIGYDAKRRRKSAVGWWFIAFLLGPIGWLIWIFIRTRRPTMIQTQKGALQMGLVGIFLCLISLYFIRGPGAEGVGIVSFLPLAGVVWGWIFLGFGLLCVVGAIVMILND